MHSLSSEDHPNVPPRQTCGGHCQAPCQKRDPRCLVIAACSGLIVVLQKNREGLFLPSLLPELVYASLPHFSDAMSAACAQQGFDQLVIVGAPNDIAWMRVALPMEAQERLVAEIPYPLLPEWLQEPGLQQLSAVLWPLIR